MNIKVIYQWLLRYMFFSSRFTYTTISRSFLTSVFQIFKVNPSLFKVEVRRDGKNNPDFKEVIFINPNFQGFFFFVPFHCIFLTITKFIFLVHSSTATYVLGCVISFGKRNLPTQKEMVLLRSFVHI